MSLKKKFLNEAHFLRPADAYSETKKICCSSPSNIALIKYWGKKSEQIPENPSLSFSLNVSRTNTCIHYSYQPETDIDQSIRFYFEGKEKPDFGLRIIKYFETLLPYFPFLEQLNFRIESSNTFPHSSGIASSASAMSALAFGICEIERILFNPTLPEAEFYEKVSFMARLGSGSASRSVYPHFAIWGKTKNLSSSSNEAAIPLQIKLHPDFKQLYDAVLITSSEKKKVSSSQGHKSMEDHPFAKFRFNQAHENLIKITKVLENGDWMEFSAICEEEALSIHAMMMSAKNPYSLLNENTWHIIHRIREEREKKALKICFTLDAGPNVHLIYPSSERTIVKAFIEKKLIPFCENQIWIDDKMGQGATISY